MFFKICLKYHDISSSANMHITLYLMALITSVLKVFLCDIKFTTILVQQILLPSWKYAAAFSRLHWMYASIDFYLYRGTIQSNLVCTYEYRRTCKLLPREYIVASQVAFCERVLQFKKYTYIYIYISCLKCFYFKNNLKYKKNTRTLCPIRYFVFRSAFII